RAVEEESRQEGSQLEGSLALHGVTCTCRSLDESYPRHHVEHCRIELRRRWPMPGADRNVELKVIVSSGIRARPGFERSMCPSRRRSISPTIADGSGREKVHPAHRLSQ